MIPVALDAVALPLAVAGRGPLAARRLQALREGGAYDPQLFCDQPDDDLIRLAGPALRRALPARSDLVGIRALWIAGLPDDEAADLAALARSERVLVNVEDRSALCDFHSVASVRRGDLLLTVSTGGASPGLAARIRARLAAEFGTEWAGRVALLRTRRDAWRRDGENVAERTDALLRDTGWLT